MKTGYLLDLKMGQVRFKNSSILNINIIVLEWVPCLWTQWSALWHSCKWQPVTWLSDLANMAFSNEIFLIFTWTVHYEIEFNWTHTPNILTHNSGSNWARKMTKYILESAGGTLESYIGQSPQHAQQRDLNTQTLLKFQLLRNALVKVVSIFRNDNYYFIWTTPNGHSNCPMSFHNFGCK